MAASHGDTVTRVYFTCRSPVSHDCRLPPHVAETTGNSLRVHWQALILPGASAMCSVV